MPIIINKTNWVQALEAKVQKALKATQQEIYEVIQRHSQRYYDEYTPTVYERTQQFLNSLIKTELVRAGNCISCRVQIDDNYLQYKYPGSPNWRSNIPATGQDVAQWANEHTHGSIIHRGSAFWEDAMRDLGGEQGIYAIMEKNLKNAGIPVK